MAPKYPDWTCFLLLLAAVTLYLLPMGTAQAERFWPHYGSWGGDDYAPFGRHGSYRSWGWGDYEPFRQRRPQRASKSYESERKPKPEEVVKGPLQIIISIADQKISVYDDGALIARSSVSTGVQGHPTPLGVFSVIGKELWHRSNPMPYMQRITWSGIALHAGKLPGHPASHGCIRLAKDFAVRLWHLTKRGTRVIIAANTVDPIQIPNLRLFSESKTAFGAQAPSSDGSAGKELPAVAPTPAALRQNTQPENTGQLPVVGVTPPKKTTPISVFVSRKLSRLFVRQRFTSLFDAAIKIENPDEPFGTHVFTLLQSEAGGAPFRWNVVSMPRPLEQGSGGPIRPDLSPDQANAASDRIEIPQDVVNRISQLLTPGSSLIVSDYGLSRETGDDTDFIVVMP